MAYGILLDSSVVISHLRGKLNVAERIPGSEPIFLSLTALGELYKGVLKSRNPEKNREQLDDFLQTVAVLYPDTATAMHYAQIAIDLERKGTPIPENDIWIAAVAMECSMPLATQDAHFEKVDGLTLLKW
jgi:tRNA(fMet)-specific endonuclease VapC